MASLIDIINQNRGEKTTTPEPKPTFASGSISDIIINTVRKTQPTVQPQEPIQPTKTPIGATRSFEEEPDVITGAQRRAEPPSIGATRSFEPEVLPEQVPIPQLDKDPKIAAIESRFYSIKDPAARAEELRSLPMDKGVDLIGKLPENEQVPIKEELQKLANEDRKRNAFAEGILFSTPIPTFFPKETKEEMAKVAESAPLLSTAGQIAGTVGQAMIGSQLVGGLLAKTPIGKSKLLTDALTRFTVAGGIAAEQNIGRKDIKEAIGDVVQQSGGGLISLIPELVAPPGVAQIIAQPLGDLIYDVAIGAYRGQDITSKDWWKSEIISLATSMGFAIKDVTSGETFKIDQQTKIDEITKLFKSDKPLEIVPKGETNVPEVQAKTEAEITPAQPPEAPPAPAAAHKPIEVMETEARQAVVPGEQTVTEPSTEGAAPAKPTEYIVEEMSMGEMIKEARRLNLPFTLDANGNVRGDFKRFKKALALAIDFDRIKKAPAKPEPSIQEKITSMEAQPNPLTMGGIAAGQELPKYAGNINLERINADYGPKRVILETSADYAGKIDEERRGQITHEATRELADNLGMTEKDLLKRKKGQAFNAEQALASRDLLNSSANRILELKNGLAEKRKAGTLTDEDLANFSLEMKKHAAIQAEVAGITAEAGRALSSFNIMSEAKAKAKSVEELLKVAGGKDINTDILDKLIKIDPENVPAINKFIRKSVFAKTKDAIYEVWINSILSAPSTHIVNITSNTATGLYRTLVEKPIAAGIEKILAPLQKRPAERFFREIPDELYGFGKGLGEAVATMKETFGSDVQQAGTKIESQQYTIPGKAGKIIRTPTKALSAADEFFKTVIYRGTLNSLAHRKARIEGKKGADVETRVQEILKEPPEYMMKKAREEADYRTYTNPLGKVMTSLMKARNAMPGAKYIIPFIKTPTNIAKFALERTPIIGQGIAAHKIATGEVKGAEISDELAKSTIGTLLAIATISLAKQGIITGAGSQNKKNREALYRTGWLPYSVKYGDKYYSFSRMEPIASVVGMAADFAELKLDKDADLKKDVVVDLASKISASFGKNILSKTFMSGLSNFINAITDYERYGERTISQLAGSLIPNIIASGARATDDELKRITNLGETIKSRIPYLSKSVPGKRDIWGNKIKKASTGLEAFLSPVTVNKESKDRLDKELIRVGAGIGAPSPSITLNKEKIELDPVIYDKYTEVVGKISRRYIENLLSSDEYRSSNDEEKKALIESSFRKARSLVREKYAAMQLRKDNAKK
ncbi:MAG: hypothetical protein ACWGNI_00070 [Desulfobacterales bacterium]